MSNIVSIVRTKKYTDDDIKRTIYRGLDLLNYQQDNMRNISIKVNLCYYWHYSTGETTDPRVVSSVVDYIREKWNENASISIVESDATAVRMKYAFKMLGYEELAKKKKVNLVNLSQRPSKATLVSCGKHVFKFQVPDIILNSDIFISIPKPKYHITKISCALKNQFGCNPAPKKFLWHSNLDEAIVALNKIMKPNVVVVDGLIVKGSFPKKLGLILAGTNPLTVDFIVAQLMNFDPFQIKHISLAIKENVGEPKDIIIRGEDIKTLKKEFPQLPKESRLSRSITNLKSFAYNVYLKVVKDVPLY